MSIISQTINSVKTIASPLSAFLAGTGLTCCAFSLLSSTLALRMNQNGVPTSEAGIILSLYYCGYVIASLISYLVSSLAALTMWSRLITSLNKARESRRRLDAYFSIPIPEKGELVSPLVFNEGTPIAFEDVSYAYGAKDGGRAVSHLSFELPYGKGIGLVGGTGSGKSTCLKLLSGLFAPSEGRILLGDQVVSENGQKKLDLRSFFTYVPQKITLFRGTVRDNLKLAKPDARDEEMLLALEKAQALAFLQEKGNPLEVAIKEGGSNLSGGQKQRLALARAFLSPAPILLLDDSLSALDYLTEKKIRDELPTLFPTRFLISSRLSLVEGMDEILFFEHGEIVARGTHEQLLATCPSYKELADIQKGEVA